MLNGSNVVAHWHQNPAALVIEKRELMRLECLGALPSQSFGAITLISRSAIVLTS